MISITLRSYILLLPFCFQRDPLVAFLSLIIPSLAELYPGEPLFQGFKSMLQKWKWSAFLMHTRWSLPEVPSSLLGPITLQVEMLGQQDWGWCGELIVWALWFILRSLKSFLLAIQDRDILYWKHFPWSISYNLRGNRESLVQQQKEMAFCLWSLLLFQEFGVLFIYRRDRGQTGRKKSHLLAHSINVYSGSRGNVGRRPNWKVITQSKSFTRVIAAQSLQPSLQFSGVCIARNQEAGTELWRERGGIIWDVGVSASMLNAHTVTRVLCAI